MSKGPELAANYCDFRVGIGLNKTIPAKKRLTTFGISTVGTVLVIVDKLYIAK